MASVTLLLLPVGSRGDSLEEMIEVDGIFSMFKEVIDDSSSTREIKSVFTSTDDILPHQL